MVKQVMIRKAADNKYLHKDFHGAMNLALEYLRTRFGADVARDYLRQYADAFYAPLKRDLRRRGLIALKEHLRHVYAVEGGSIKIHSNKDELRLATAFCPAVKHIRKMRLPISPLFIETERAVYAAICADTPFAFELARYDKKTGQAILRFYPVSSRPLKKSGLRRGSRRLQRRKK